MRTNIPTRELPPELKKLLPSGYRKRSVNLVVTDSVTPYGYYWDGGSKTDWTHFQNGKVQSIKLPGYPFTEEVPTIPIDEDNIVVTSGTFCGKTSTATFYVSKFGRNE